MQSYHTNVLRKIEYTDGTKTTTYQIFKNNRGKINNHEIKTIAESIFEKMPNKQSSNFTIKAHTDPIPKEDMGEVMIQGLDAANWRTMKTYSEMSYVDEYADDYFNGREVADKTKFQKYFQLMITINS